MRSGLQEKQTEGLYDSCKSNNGDGDNRRLLSHPAGEGVQLNCATDASNGHEQRCQ